jgi:chemotaxis protein CheZ
MTEAETIMGLEPTDLAAYKAEVDAAMMRIFEACSFQDLTGQRVTKVIATLRHIEDRVTKFAGALGVTDSVQKETAEEARARELLLNGPAMNGPSTSQDDIDALFS